MAEVLACPTRPTLIRRPTSSSTVSTLASSTRSSSSSCSSRRKVSLSPQTVLRHAFHRPDSLSSCTSLDSDGNAVEPKETTTAICRTPFESTMDALVYSESIRALSLSSMRLQISKVDMDSVRASPLALPDLDTSSPASPPPSPPSSKATAPSSRRRAPNKSTNLSFTQVVDCLWAPATPTKPWATKFTTVASKPAEIDTRHPSTCLDDDDARVEERKKEMKAWMKERKRLRLAAKAERWRAKLTILDEGFVRC